MRIQGSSSLITQNKAFSKILSQLKLVIDTDSSILLTGETGTGKELLMEFIHTNSNRKNMPCIKIGLASIPASLLESELFGHEKGAYTSAANEKKGLFEQANRGSVFLDDIDDFPFELQSKLLRILESGEMMRIGAVRPIPVDVRLITASKIDLKKLVKQGKFRADLYYRINVVPINIPSLRQRIDDIPLLVDYFIKCFAPARIIKVAPEVIDALQNYPWPGNIRELKNVIHRAVLFCGSEINLKDLPEEISGFNSVKSFTDSCAKCIISNNLPFKESISRLEAKLIRQALQECKGNKLAAAKLLSLPFSTFNDKLKKYKIDGEVELSLLEAV